MSNLATQMEARRAAPERAGQKTLVDYIEAQKSEFARALPASIKPERFARLVLTECKKTPRLLECTPSSVLGGAMLAAQLGLTFGPLGHAYLVPFKNKGRYQATFIIGYRGLIDLARRSGNIETIVAREVCEHDDFDWQYGLDERLVHKPKLTGRGKVIAYYGVARFRDGGHMILVMSPDDINKYRDRSRAKDDGPWVNDYDAMAKKTVIRRMASFLPLSVEAASAVEADEKVVTRFDDNVLDIEGEEIDPNTTEGSGDDGSSSDGDAGTAGDGADGHDVGRTEPEPDPATEDGEGEAGGTGRSSAKPSSSKQQRLTEEDA